MEGERIMLNVLMICTEKLPVPNIRGGAIQTYIDGVSSMLSEKYQLTILGRSDKSLPSLEMRDNIQYARIPGGEFIQYRDEVVQYLIDKDYDIIHIFNRPRLVLPVRQVAPHARIILSLHNDMFNLEKIHPEEAKLVIQETERIVTVSDYVGNVVRDLYPEASGKLRTIYSGVDVTQFTPCNTEEALQIREAIRAEHQLQSKKVILFVGRLSQTKGPDVLIRALPELAKRYPDIALIIVGSKWFGGNQISDYVAYVRALAERSTVPIVTTGYVGPDKTHEWYWAGDIFVCSSQWQEPLARVHFEAMASGMPIITTARGGNPEVITPYENGLIVEEPEKTMCFVEKISELLSNEELCHKMGQNNRMLAESKFFWERVANDILEVWEGVPAK